VSIFFFILNNTSTSQTCALFAGSNIELQQFNLAVRTSYKSDWKEK
jgi:hypothetical protein